MIVVDASVAVKWTVAEPGRDEALRVLVQADEMVAPDLLIAEAANVLRKKSKTGEISVLQSEEALRAIQLAIPRLVPSSELAEDALTLAQKLDHSVYDCFYLACALPVAAKLVTADDKFVAKCRIHGFASFVCSPAEVDVEEQLPLVGIDRSKLATIERLSAHMEKTFESLHASAQTSQNSGQSLFVSSDYRPAFDSPAYRRLIAEMDKLSDDELGTLVALGWLGRSYNRAEEWASLVNNASTMVAEGRSEHKRYFIAQMSNVTRGLAKLRASEPPRSPR